MDYQSRSNGWGALLEHYWFLFIVLGVLASTCVPTLFFFRGSKPLSLEPVNGAMADDSRAVFWGLLHDSKTNQLQFVLLIPPTSTIGGGIRTSYSGWYDYCNLKIVRNGHEWKIDGNADRKTGIASLLVCDLTADSTTKLDLRKSQFWRINEDGVPAILDKIDPAIMNQIMTNAESLFMQRQSLTARR